MEEPWFIGVLIGVVGGTLWLALCIFSIWLCKKRKSKKKMMQNGLYTGMLFHKFKKRKKHRTFSDWDENTQSPYKQML